MTQARRWSLLAAVTAVAVLAAGWFLLLSPKRGEAAELRTQTAASEQANLQLRSKLEQLKALAPELPKREAEFAAIRRQIPDNPALPELIRQLTAAAEKSGADLVALAPETPKVLTPASAPVAAGTTAPAGEQLYQVPLKVQLEGSYSQLEDFVERLEKLRRVMLVTSFTLGTESSDAQASSGSIKLDLMGRVYMIQSAAPATAPQAGTAATTTPGATTPGSGTATPAASQPPAN
ncbi:MAG: hypothetical protein QOE19_2984 [Actinomycetota bacterium]|nr:hypothetical protein [Actinomycetota bacterium]